MPKRVLEITIAESCDIIRAIDTAIEHEDSWIDSLGNYDKTMTTEACRKIARWKKLLTKLRAAWKPKE